MEVLARFTHDTVDRTKDNQPHLVVTLKAPLLDASKKRPAICVIQLIDLSGSMSGDKLEYAKKAMAKLVDQLAPGDISGLVGFESRVHVLVKPEEVTEAFKIKLKRAIGALRVMGGTNLCEGLLNAVSLVEKLDLSPKYLKRVIMFTDGQPTDGITDQEQIIKLMGSQNPSITVSAFGYGNTGGGTYNGCDQEFLTKLAVAGHGNYAYVQNPDAALTAFGRELGGLLSTYAQDIVVHVEPANGHRIGNIVTDVVMTQDPVGESEVKISDIRSEESRNFVFETNLLKQAKAFPRAVNIFSVNVSYSVLTDEGKRETRVVEGKAKIQFVDADDAQKEPTKEVDEIVAMAQLIRAQLTAEEAAKKGAFAAAQDIMEYTSNAVKSRGHIGIAGLGGAVKRRLASSATYGASAGYLRSTAAVGTRSYTTSTDAEARADFGIAVAACSADVGEGFFGNASMEKLGNAFSADPSGGLGIQVTPDPAANWLVQSPVSLKVEAPLEEEDSEPLSK